MSDAERELVEPQVCRSRLQRVDTSYTVCELPHGHDGEHRAPMSRGAIVWTDGEADPKDAA